MTMCDDLAVMVLAELVRWEAEIAARPRPPAWKTWEVQPDSEDREYGPRYSPTWFGDTTATEAGRVRVLRMLYRLADAGLIELTRSPGGRLERIQLTAAGSEVATEIPPRPGKSLWLRS